MFQSGKFIIKKKKGHMFFGSTLQVKTTGLIDLTKKQHPYYLIQLLLKLKKLFGRTGP
jgi:hypothetical protein